MSVRIKDAIAKGWYIFDEKTGSIDENYDWSKVDTANITVLCPNQSIRKFTELNKYMDSKIINLNAKHLTPLLDKFERMSDAELSHITLGTEAPAETRARIKAARDKGYTFLPCNCVHHKPTGECFGWTPESRA